MNRKWLLVSVVLLVALGFVGAILAAARTQSVLAADTSHTVSEESSSIGLPTTNIMLVDDDGNTPDAQAYYVELLASLGYSFTVWDAVEVEPTAADLQNYDAVIWFTGNSYSSNTGPSSQTETELASWLDTNGACLLMSSQDYLFAQGLTPFMTNYLGVADAQSDVAQTVVTGTHAYDGLGPFNLSFPMSFTNYSDVFTLTAQAEDAFVGDKHAYSGGGGGFLNEGGRLVPTGVLTSTPNSSHTAASYLKNDVFGWQTTWLGFPLEALPDYLSQLRTLNRFLSNCFSTDLQTINTASAPVVHVGQPYSYTIRVVNNGPYRATDITVQDFVPNSADVSAIYDSQTFLCSLTLTQNINCSIPDLQVGQVETMTFLVTPTLPGNITNFVFSTNFSPDAFPANNSTSASVRVLAVGDTSIYLDKVVPDSIDRDFGGVLNVIGANFMPGMEILLNGVPLTYTLDTQYPNAYLQAFVPSGFARGQFSLIAQNPGGDQDILFKSVVVYDSNDLQVNSVIPEAGPNDRPVLLNIQGDGFSPGMSGELIDSSSTGVFYSLEAVNFISPTLIRALAPYGLPEGFYDVRVYNPSEASATLPQGYHSLDWAAADDLGAFDFDLFTVPVSPREGQNVTVGLTVRRHTGPLAPLSGGPVSADVTLGISAGTELPSVVLSTTGVISPNSTISITVPWTPELAGLYHISMDIASADLGVDTIPGNNTVDRNIVVLPASSDADAPVITDLSINGGALITPIPTVFLTATATDVGTGPSQIYYIDYAFDRNLGDWYPAKRSGWLSYGTSTTNYEWLLDSTAGAHYIQAWVADGAGNISAPKSSFINLVYPKNNIIHDGGQVYRFPLLPLTMLQIDLTSLTGDADMFAWAPDGTLAAAAFGSNPFEQISLIAPVNPPGLYQIDVYGFETTSYWFEVSVGGVTAPEAIDAVRGHLKGSDTPLLQVTNNPGGDVSVPQPTTTVHLFLPLVIR